MRDVMNGTSTVEGSIRPAAMETVSGRPYGLAAWVLSKNAERWRRRAQFYERHRDYFPRLSSGRFIARCRQLEATYGVLSRAIWNMTPRVQWAPGRPIVSQIG
jgi:hypothetical protein